MPSPRKIGQYRHVPGTEFVYDSEGRARPVRGRRRFPYLGQVLLLNGALAPVVAAAVTSGFRAAGLSRLLPEHYGDVRVAGAPSLENLLFGAGLPEVVLAGGVSGLLLWLLLWPHPVDPSAERSGIWAVWAALAPTGLVVGLAMAPVVAVTGAYGLCLRAMPAEIPWFARTVIGIPGALALSVTALFTGTVPAVLLVLGALHGLATALAVAAVRPGFPLESA